MKRTLEEYSRERIFFKASLRGFAKQNLGGYVKRHNKNNDNNKLNFRNILYASVQKMNVSSIDIVRGDMDADKILHVSKNSIIKKRNLSSTYEHIQKINNDLIKIIYDDANKFIHPHNFRIGKDNKSLVRNASRKIDKTLYINRSNKRFIGIDATNLNVRRELVNNIDIKLSKSAEYGNGMLSISFDVVSKIPIAYRLVSDTNGNFDKKKVAETNGLLGQLYLFTSNDVLIFDRLYYSIELMCTLNRLGIGYIFRLKNNSKLFATIGIGKSKIVIHNGVRVQLFKYKINNEVYCILTSITEKISISEIKGLYWLRWKVETHIKKMKYDALCNTPIFDRAIS